MKTIHILMFTLAAVLLSTLAFADHYHKGYGYHHGCGYGMTNWNMGTLDGDNDGAVTFEEFGKTQTDRLRSAFNLIDTNKDGEIDESEWNELKRVHGIGEDNAS